MLPFLRIWAESQLGQWGRFLVSCWTFVYSGNSIKEIPYYNKSHFSVFDKLLFWICFLITIFPQNKFSLLIKYYQQLKEFPCLSSFLLRNWVPTFNFTFCTDAQTSMISSIVAFGAFGSVADVTWRDRHLLRGYARNSQGAVWRTAHGGELIEGAWLEVSSSL